MAKFDYCRVGIDSREGGRLLYCVDYGDDRNEELEGLSLLEALNLLGQRGWELCWVLKSEAAAYMKRKLDGD
jgi:hypothetical protein